MAKRELTIPPIKKNPRNGRINQYDASVVIGNSKPDVFIDAIGNETATERQPSGNRKATKRKPKRSQRVYFVPNKVTKAIIEDWKQKYGNRFYSAIINSAIEKHVV